MNHYDYNNEDVRHHLSLLQDSITRMAACSSNCKTWCITLVCALLALVIANPDYGCHIWIAALPTSLFYLLDVYYLSLEKRFRSKEMEFVRKTQAGDNLASLLYDLTPDANSWRTIIKSALSPATWPIYALILACLFLIH